MKFVFPFLLFFYSTLAASELSRTEYLELIKTHPEMVMPRGDASKGEIEILLDPEKMAAIEMATGRDVGILKSDNHWIWLNDACRFPDGTEGVIGRILARSLEPRPGAAVLPLLSDGIKIGHRHFGCRNQPVVVVLELAPRGSLCVRV